MTHITLGHRISLRIAIGFCIFFVWFFLSAVLDSRTAENVTIGTAIVLGVLVFLHERIETEGQLPWSERIVIVLTLAFLGVAGVPFFVPPIRYARWVVLVSLVLAALGAATLFRLEYLGHVGQNQKLRSGKEE